eukprot:CAMPEP_0195068428 /NCGR_PEP_ID=MMETSP0448-20130528/13161_1 /TAXON_ID=66468 /ORGANISM="Heterocapsa triquestra, Strain CCMP 448" /LENGTH=105 /DNA_ID=CAMNT_0040099957 /DNA_START=270 /DNA_END=584 /DNA_ORIENTATION=+
MSRSSLIRTSTNAPVVASICSVLPFTWVSTNRFIVRCVELSLEPPDSSLDDDERRLLGGSPPLAALDAEDCDVGTGGMAAGVRAGAARRCGGCSTAGSSSSSSSS